MKFAPSVNRRVALFLSRYFSATFDTGYPVLKSRNQLKKLNLAQNRKQKLK